MKKILLSLMILSASLQGHASESCGTTEPTAQIKAKLIALLIPTASNSGNCKIITEKSWKRAYSEEDHDISNYATLKLEYLKTLVWSSESFFVGGSYGNQPLPDENVNAVMLQAVLDEKSTISQNLIKQLKTFGCL